MTANPSIQPGRHNGLDTLRALAITLVFMYHYAAFVSGEYTFGLGSELGWMGVDLFFVLSGYLIANQLLAGLVARRKLSLKAFYVRRALRTLPVFWVVLALYFAFPSIMGGNTPPALWRFVSFTQNWQLQPGTAFSHAWSLCIEEQFYLVLPLILLAGARFGTSRTQAWLVLAGLIITGIVSRTLLWQAYSQGSANHTDYFYYANIYYATLCRADEFLPGVAIALIKHLHPAFWQKLIQRGQRNLFAGVVAITLVMWGMHQSYYVANHGYGFWMTTFGYSLGAMAFGLLVIAALSPSSWLARVRIPGAYTLAIWSYSFYLIHKPVAHIVQQLLKPMGVPGSLLLVVVTLACLLATWLLHHWIEQPAMRWRDRHLPGNFEKPVIPTLAVQQT